MQTTLTEQQTAAIHRFFSHVSNDIDASQSWQCSYRADDELFLAPDHSFFTGVSVAPCMEKLGMPVLNIRIDMHPVSAPSLRNARIRVTVRNNSGRAVLNWTSDTLGQMDRPVTGAGYPMCFAIPMDDSALQSIRPDASNRFYIMLEDEKGNIIDDATGQIAFHRQSH